MTFSRTMLALAAALALFACGKKDGAGTGEGAVKANAASPLEADYRLKDAAPLDFDALLALMPKRERPTYDSAKFDGDLGATVVTNLRFADAGDGESVLVKRAEFYGVDLDALNRVRASEEAPAEDAAEAFSNLEKRLSLGDPATFDAPFEKAFEKVRLFNISAEGFGEEEGELSIGGIEFDQLEIRQGGVGSYGVKNMAAGMFNAFRLAGLYFKDISIATHGADAPAVVVSAPDLRFVGLGGGKLSAVIANDLEYQMSQSDASIAAMSEAMGPQGAMLMNGPLRAFLAPKNQRATVKSFEWRGIDMSGLLEWGLKGEKPPATARNLIDLGTINAADMNTFIEDRRVATVKEATVSTAKFAWLIPSEIRADTKGAVTDFTAYVPETETAVLDILKEHGLDNVPSDGYAEWTWNPDSGAADLDYEANAKGLADFSMAFGLDGLKLADIAAAQEANQPDMIAAAVAFRNLSVKIKDEKALDVLFALSALQMGGTAADLRQSAPAMIRLSGAQAAQMNPRIGDYVNAVADFVASGGGLEISAKPAKPVSLAALQAAGTTAPQTLPDVLNLTVTHTK